MKRNSRNYRKQSKTQIILKEHIKNNIKIYIVTGLVFLLGIILGIFFINSSSEEQIEEIIIYVNQAITNINTDNNNYLKELIFENMLIIGILWLAGLTIIGIIINYLIVCAKGFCIGYTIFAIAMSLGTWKSIIFVFTTMFVQNLLLIPAIIATTVSGMRFFKNIIQDRRRENIILEIIRHTVFCIIMLLIALCSSFLEIYLSNYLLSLCLKIFI